MDTLYRIQGKNLTVLRIWHLIILTPSLDMVWAEAWQQSVKS